MPMTHDGDPPFVCPLDRTRHAVAGLDEAGCGPLAGSVVAACVVLDPAHPICGLNDSKRLSPRRREALYAEITATARAWGVASVSAAVIDRINIRNAALQAMHEAYLSMGLPCELLLIDGRSTLRALQGGPQQLAVVGGDRRAEEIMAASIVAKVTRDREMLELDRHYPDYGFARHKGYPTPEHLRIIARQGILPCYRMTYAPVRRLLQPSRDEAPA